MRIILTIFFLLIYTVTFSQRKVPHNNPNFKKYLELGFKYLELRKRDSLEFYIRKSDSVLKTKLDSSNYYQLQVLKANLTIRKNKTDIAIWQLLKTQTYFTKVKDSANLAKTLYTLAIANYYLNRRSISIEYFEKSYELKNHISKKLATKILQNLASMDLEIGTGIREDRISFIKKAIKNYDKVIKVYQEENWTNNEILATTLLAECYNQLAEYEKALKIIEWAILLSKKTNNKSEEGFALIKKASILFK